MFGSCQAAKLKLVSNRCDRQILYCKQVTICIISNVFISLNEQKLDYLKCQVPMLLIYKLLRLAAPVRGIGFLLLHHPAPVVAITTIRY